MDNLVSRAEEQANYLRERTEVRPALLATWHFGKAVPLAAKGASDAASLVADARLARTVLARGGADGPVQPDTLLAAAIRQEDEGAGGLQRRPPRYRGREVTS